MEWIVWRRSAYWIVFVAVFLAVAVWESRRPARCARQATGERWTKHLALMFFSGFCALALRTTPALTSLWAGQREFGLLHLFPVPVPVAFALSILILDFNKYAAHRLLHLLPWLWRVHEVHHSDADFDVATSGRAHPLEVIYMQAAAIAWVAAIGMPVAAVAVAEVIAAGQSLFEHGNISLPTPLERWLRRVMITPDVHRIHHSQRIEDQNSNFGELFPWWDRLLGTYSASSPETNVGLAGFAETRTLRSSYLLFGPFFRS